ncbi:hypothetical protein AGABI1DRAFT_121852 [Agaricus bisporus var. burnettii JB137-S8]|uniref:Cytochrome P450 n=1 Tax=Agaricus bisporus var. burnettii (strain JB137-S8 / ATCC MYA-4627 / FGSC 10392) TaxID=597362 RepID=K5XS70_AGABU|nr:uncharacterized protein AGABI1DRAFT_121852 [Agaricus bisporus var. burnettii JB137-S8]EKM77775.1 hypothetical protein AGABI1DRAFT_121852 [Agaricus bisporus var. burnettii JB137-S8]
MGLPYFTSLTGLGILYFLYRYVKTTNVNPRRLPLPPGPKRYPLIGSILDVPPSRPWLVYDEWFKTYGDLVYFKLLGKSFLLVGSLERAVDIFEKRSTNYSDRPHMVMLMDFIGWDYNFALIPYGPWWRRHRRAFHEYFGSKKLPQYLPVQVRHVRGFLRRLLASPEDFLSHTRHLFAALITEVAYGIEIQDHNDPYVQQIEEVIKGVGEASVPGRYLVEVFPIMKYIPSWFPGAGWKRKAAYYRRINDRVSREPYEIVKENLKKGTAAPSVAAALIEALPEGNTKERAEAETVAMNVSGTAFLGAADTTVATIQSFILAMCLHPEVQKKAHEELDGVLQGKRLPELEDQKYMPYITAIAKEATRWHPVLPTGVPHMSTEDDEYHGYFIPKGTIVIGSIWSILHDPEAYEDPLRFMPERFMKHGKLDPNVRDPSVAAFGFGRRICPGMNMSDISLFLTVASILAVYDIQTELDEGGKPVQMSGEYTVGNFQ